MDEPSVSVDTRAATRRGLGHAAEKAGQSLLKKVFGN